MKPMLRSPADATPVLIRPIAPDDKQRLADGMAQLSTASIRRRFLAAKPALSAAELRYLTEVDGSDHLALVAVLGGAEGPIVGVARCVRLEPGGDTAEFAIVVGDALQRQGVGTALGAALAQAACRAGIRRFSATMLADNEAVRRLMAGFALRLEQREQHGGVCELVAELPGCAQDGTPVPLAA
jgi:RimJ/RimL family protein N-acetyltransferase